MKILVVVPAYNEAENIGPLLEQLLRLPLLLEVLVVDDNSPDGTGGLVQAAAEKDARVHLLARAGKLGLGSAQRKGLRYGLANGFDRMVIMDADFSHDPAVLPELVQATETADVAVGSRYIPGGRIQGWPWHRLALSRGSNLLARLALGPGLHDWTGAYRCYRREVAAALPLDRMRSDGYSFAEELLYTIRKLGFRVTEIPITFVDRTRGRSKINRSEVWKAAFLLLRLGLKRVFSRP
jgi:dolichol-phosphate mannosyltransferase